MEGTCADSVGGCVRVKGSTLTHLSSEMFKGQRGESNTCQTLRPAPKQTIKLLLPSNKAAKFCFTLLSSFHQHVLRLCPGSGPVPFLYMVQTDLQGSWKTNGVIYVMRHLLKKERQP